MIYTAARLISESGGGFAIVEQKLGGSRRPKENNCSPRLNSCYGGGLEAVIERVLV